MSINPSCWLNSVPGRWRASVRIRREWFDSFSFLESLMFPPGIPFKECCFSKNRIHEKFRWSLLFRAFSKIRSRTENIFLRVERTTWQVSQDSSYGLWITSLTTFGQSLYIWHQLSLSKLVAMFHNFPYTATISTPRPKVKSTSRPYSLANKWFLVCHVLPFLFHRIRSNIYRRLTRGVIGLLTQKSSYRENLPCARDFRSIVRSILMQRSINLVFVVSILKSHSPAVLEICRGRGNLVFQAILRLWDVFLCSNYYTARTRAWKPDKQGLLAGQRYPITRSGWPAGTLTPPQRN